jgi:hypothetical protein
LRNGKDESKKNDILYNRRSLVSERKNGPPVRTKNKGGAMKNLHEVVDVYTDKDKNPCYLGREVVSVSARIDIQAKIKLQVLSGLFGKKQTPLLAELIETAVNEVFDQVELPDTLQKEYEREVKKLNHS